MFIYGDKKRHLVPYPDAQPRRLTTMPIEHLLSKTLNELLHSAELLTFGACPTMGRGLVCASVEHSTRRYG